ncbi:class I SAM-dependent methyltransferase [Alicyclobacillus fodiniaquatilis]|uniref:Class I SAM-dependent methyltransferase n=1 Tax=Alicyclobacillus fodiniaquatilis TaxID=1661150 RepID=A0ABW4JJR0_9BACL
MDTLDIKSLLRASYDGQANERDNFSKANWKVRERDLFLSHLRERHLKNLLEIGAGTGQDSLFFIDNGIEATATDMSGEMVRLCREKNLSAYQMDFYNLEFPTESFDAVWSLNCLLHVPKRDLPSVLEGIRDVLKPGGLFYLGVYGGEDSEGVWEGDSSVPKRFFSFHTDQSIQYVVSKYFEIIYFKTVDYGHESLHFQSMILV